MPTHSSIPRLLDILEAIDRIGILVAESSLLACETDWRGQWMIERGVEIISEASRHLPTELKERHPDIPWRKVAGVGNVLRHDYESVSAPILWALALNDLPKLKRVRELELELLRR